MTLSVKKCTTVMKIKNVVFAQWESDDDDDDDDDGDNDNGSSWHRWKNPRLSSIPVKPSVSSPFKKNSS